MYGLHLHADEERIYRIAQDSDLLRQYCIITFIKEIEALVTELYDFFKINNIPFVEKAHHLRAPVIHLESQDSDKQNITGSPFWGNLIGADMTEENAEMVFATYFAHYTFEELKWWAVACAFTQLLAREQFSFDEMKSLVFEPTIND